MKITPETVSYVANLARLSVTAEEAVNLSAEMDVILSYVEKLNCLDTHGITPTAHAVPLENAFREDRAEPSLGSALALRNAPDQGEGCFRVPKVIE
ncbi:MAG: Asp-tRNA(Asn)/Glu-tRNA(Gln) amidotransferase subunit GatC [Deltaproteobacteria bacterium]|nr:Asp-tRNA(Asn)/Glu-tRNA(Gln) amidotransferase subunit GatC [Deltaproteobacteria bacterium]